MPDKDLHRESIFSVEFWRISLLRLNFLFNEGPVEHWKHSKNCNKQIERKILTIQWIMKQYYFTKGNLNTKNKVITKTYSPKKDVYFVTTNDLFLDSVH